MIEKPTLLSCVSIDWLQIHTKIIVFQALEAEKSKTEMFRISAKDIRHNVFSKHREISLLQGAEWVVCAVVSFCPLSSILPENSAHLKIINKFLYQDSLKILVSQLLDELELKFHSVSRMDIAYDFKSFYKRSVPVFFKQFIKGSILKLKSTGFHLDGKATRSMPIHYLRFGSRTTPVHFYIYNKSKELREKTDKPYIKERWKKAGLKHLHYDIWRMEFVLLPSQFGVISKDSGEVIMFNGLEVCDSAFWYNLFFTLTAQFGVFVLNDGQIKKQRMKRIELFRAADFESLYQKCSFKKISNRMDKVFIKMLHQLNEAWRLHNKDPIPVSDALVNYIDERDLGRWYRDMMDAKEK